MESQLSVLFWTKEERLCLRFLFHAELTHVDEYHSFGLRLSWRYVHFQCNNTKEALKLWHSLMPRRGRSFSSGDKIEKSAESDNSDLFKDLIWGKGTGNSWIVGTATSQHLRKLTRYHPLPWWQRGWCFLQPGECGQSSYHCHPLGDQESPKISTWVR